MKRLYAAWSRSCGRADCNPAVTGFGLAILVLAYAASRLAGHESAIVHGLRIAAASVLALAAAILLLWAMRMVMRATGQHHAPACAIPRRKTRTAPVPADAPAGYTWKIRPPEQEPVAEAGPAEPLLHRIARGAAATSADREEISAEAEALADDEAGVVVSESGSIYVLAGEGGDSA